jgi:adenylate kinase
MILFFGPPGSGKSVQGQLLVERNGWTWLSTGEIFRRSTDSKVLDQLASGELINDEATNKLLDTALRAMKDDDLVVLDGYPRTPKQAEWLIEHLPLHGREIKALIVFEVNADELVKRLSGRGRTEDSPEVIKRRLEIYDEQTQPILDFYEKRGYNVCRVDGVGSVVEVHERIQAAVEKCALV